jgi:transposase
MSDSSEVRVREPERRQGQFVFEMPEDRVAPDHPARVLWSVVSTLDLSAFLADARAVEGRAGRSRLSPTMLLTLWLYALSRGIGSAREIARMVKSDDGFRWIVGDVGVGHQTLSSFRVGNFSALDGLMSQVLGTLLCKGLLDLERVAQDGTRVRASAAAPSFRTGGALAECLEQAKLHIKAVLADADNPELSAGSHAARVGKAVEMKKRVEEAIAVVRELVEVKGKTPEAARASTTDPEARVMKMPDGGFRPGYNVQLAVAGSELGGPRTIVGLQITNLGSDMGSVTPMVEQIEDRTGVRPGALLADANHGKHTCIEQLVKLGIKPLVSVVSNAAPSQVPAIREWHDLMASDEGKRQYKPRASLCELANAHLKRRFGLDSVLVRGTQKVHSAVLLGVIAFNLLQHAPRLL